MKTPDSSKSKPRTGSLRANKTEKTGGSSSSFRSNRYGKGKVGDSGKYTGDSGIFAGKAKKASSLRARGMETSSGSASSIRSKETSKKAPAGLPSSLRAKGMEKTSSSASSLRSQEKGKPVATRSSATSSVRASVKAPAGSSSSLRAKGMSERYGKYGAKKPKGY